VTNDVFKLDAERMRAGWYSDKYFENIVGMLTDLARRGYGFGGHSTRLASAGIAARGTDIGNIEVEMQGFTRRQPFSVVAGVDKALSMLQCCTGYYDDGIPTQVGAAKFVNTYDQLEVEAVHDGAIVRYDGDPLQIWPVLKVRGRYRDFALLETPTLGALTRATRIATNVYTVLGAARGKPVLFFPARFDAHEVQAADGYAYNIAVQRFNMDNDHDVGSFISTDAQGDWWGGLGGGTVARGNSGFGRYSRMHVGVRRNPPHRDPNGSHSIDFDNDCWGNTGGMEAMSHATRATRRWKREAERYRLFGVRPDTSGNLRDQSAHRRD
jgi:nicotinate phosphoribosyltransferase